MTTMRGNKMGAAQLRHARAEAAGDAATRGVRCGPCKQPAALGGQRRKVISGILLVLFGWTMIGAKGCFDDFGNAWSKKIAASMPPPPPSYCMTDPPLDCYGVCITDPVVLAMLPPDTPPATTGCDGGADLAKLFKTDVQTILVCDESKANYAVFPPEFQITPVVVETADGCVPPPALPATMLLKDLLDLLGMGEAP